jgi:adenosylhomocysteine nucleosidase
VDPALSSPKSADTLSSRGSAPILACALAVEEKAGRDGGAWAARVGLGARLPLPEGPLVSFGLAGGLASGLAPGTLLTARRIVDADGTVLWKEEPLQIPGALTAVVCDAGVVVDDGLERRELARRSGAVAVDMESATLAATGRLAGVVRAVSDTPEQPVGALAHAALPHGGTNWGAVLRAFLAEPRTSLRAALSARSALASLRHAATALAPGAAR